MTSRDDILARVRAALRDKPVESMPPTPTARPDRPARGRDELVTLLVERIEDYRATVIRCSATELADSVARALGSHSTAVIPDGLGVSVPGAVVDAGLSATDLDGIDAVVTACRVAIAETGTIVLDHEADQGRRIITLVPDHHICIVREDQVVDDVPDAVAVLEPTRPQTWISGPSATSDIELDRVEGVHGPRTLTVVLVA